MAIAAKDVSEHHTGKRPLVAAIVLYKQALEHSATYRSLSRAIDAWSEGRAGIKIVVIDNSEETCGAGESAMVDAFKHRPDNPGLAEAYNYAADFARKLDAEWLLLLDQDTELPKTYLEVFTAATAQVPSEVGALVPRIKAGDRFVSPQRRVFGFAPGVLPVRRSGLHRHITAINSGTFARLSAIAHVGGFSTKYPIEYLDHWFFRALGLHHFAVFVLDVDVEHDLAIARFADAVSLQRYSRILEAEARFYLEENGRVTKALYASVLLYRGTKFAIDRRLSGYAEPTLGKALEVFKKLP